MKFKREAYNSNHVFYALSTLAIALLPGAIPLAGAYIVSQRIMENNPSYSIHREARRNQRALERIKNKDLLEKL